jgi:hypothetical protein
VGGGKETTVVFPAPGKLGVFKKMPKGISSSAADKTLRDEFYIRGGLAESKPVNIPAEYLKASARRGYPFQELVEVDAHT